jgi:hypothetical protein
MLDVVATLASHLLGAEDCACLPINHLFYLLFLLFFRLLLLFWLFRSHYGSGLVTVSKFKSISLITGVNNASINSELRRAPNRCRDYTGLNI